MRVAAGAVPVQGGEAQPPAPVAAGVGTPAFNRTFLLARVLLLLQLAWLLTFSTVLFERDALTFDFSIFNQARWLIVHGHLNPFDTVVGYPYWDSHGEVLMWPLAELTRLPPHGLLLLWAQDLAVVGCALVVLSWARAELADSSWTPRAAALGVGALTVILVADPWPYFAAAFDFHFEVIGAFFALLAARDLHSGKSRRAWLWAALTWSAGDVCTLFVVGVSAAALLTSRRSRSAAGMLVATLVWFGILAALHADRGSQLVGGYSYLAGAGPVRSVSVGQIAMGAVRHPARIAGHLWEDRSNLWANVAPAGLAGVWSVWALIPTGVALLPGALAANRDFSIPSFQSFLAYPFLGLGTMFAADRIWRGRRWRRSAPVLVVLCGALTLAWGAVWLPRYPSTWLRVSPTAGRFLDQVSRVIPQRAEVVVSQGVSGRFSNRPDIRPVLNAPSRVPLGARPVYFVLAPGPGIEMPVETTEAVMDQVAELPGAALVAERAGVWVWRWRPAPGQKSITLGRPAKTLPAWTFPAKAGLPVTTGPVSDWHVAANGKSGYVVAHDYWYEQQGSYRATVELSSSSQAQVEVWDAASGTLLARRIVPATLGRSRLTLAFRQQLQGSAPVFHGDGVLSVSPVPPPRGWPVEIRVFTKAGGTVSVYSVGVRRG